MRCRGRLWRCAAVVAGAAAVVVFAVHAQAPEAFQKGLDAYLKGEYAAARELWRPAAESGDAVAAFNLGVLHARGLGVEADPAEALRWYRQSALAGYANAQFNLGSAYFNGTGTERNIGQAMAWWEKAAEQDHPEAMYNLAILYRDGELVEQDLDRARRLLKEGAALGDARAGSALERLKAQAPSAAGSVAEQGATAAGDGWPDGENPAHWAVQLFAVAEEGAARRFVVDNDLADSVRIYRANVEGKTWYKGVSGSYADQAQAEGARDTLARKLPGSSPWLRRYGAIQAEAVEVVPLAVASTARSAGPAKTSGGQAGAASTGVAREPEDNSGARADTAAGPESGRTAKAQAGGGDRQAAQPGNDAQKEAEGGAGTGSKPKDNGAARLRRGQQAFNAQNYEKALEAWRPLAEQGVADAQYGIGFMYESGWGVERDYSQAFRWYEAAAQQGHVKSQFNLGMLYVNGQGVAANEALGLYWIQTAADRGDERAASYLKNLNQ